MSGCLHSPGAVLHAGRGALRHSACLTQRGPFSRRHTVLSPCCPASRRSIGLSSSRAGRPDSGAAAVLEPEATAPRDTGRQRSDPHRVWPSVAVGGLALALCLAGAAHAQSLPALSEALPASAAGFARDSPFREGAVSGFLLIFFSELGDKTFFIAVLLALKEARGTVFAGTFGALAIMTVISVALGQLLHQIDEALPTKGAVPIDDLFAAALLIFFGLRTLQGAAGADKASEEEREEAEQDVQGLKGDTAGLLLSTFLLVFAAEWGDKSFLATIALAAASSPAGVVVGAVGGHGAATGLAVVGGSYLGKYVSEQTVAYVGGSLFLVFAAVTLYDVGHQMALF